MVLFDKALQFATECHKDQYRKLDHLPYIIHPMEVAVYAGSMEGSDELLAAALLHDVIEDANVTEAQILELFGPRVLELVLCETENKRPDLPSEDTWYIRKKETIDALCKTDDIEKKKLWISDKLSNIKSFYKAYQKEGAMIWQRFHQKDPMMHAWYYFSILEATTELKDYLAYREYEEIVQYLFPEYKNSGDNT